MTKNTMGQFIAALRKANGMTQQDVADRLNVSNKAVSRWERDECAPDLSVIPALAEMLGVTCDELLKGEKNSDNHTLEKKEVNIDKQIKTLINRTLSSFKTLIRIALATAIIGLIFMFGITYGFYRPVIGFAVMLIFDACALVLSILAVSRTKDAKSENGLFEMVDNTQIERFNKVLGELSFYAFYTVFSVIIISLPSLSFILLSSIYEVCVIFFGIVMMLLLVHLKCKKPYMNWVINGEFSHEETNSIIAHRRSMTLIQMALTVIAGVLFVIASYFKTDSPEPSFWYIAINAAGLALMLANIVFFCVFIVKHKEEQSKYFLFGIRNIFLLPSALIVSNMHGFTWGEINLEYWFWEYLVYAVDYCLNIFIVYSIIEGLIKRKNNKEKD